MLLIFVRRLTPFARFHREEDFHEMDRRSHGSRLAQSTVNFQAGLIALEL